MATDISNELLCFKLLRNVLIDKGYGSIGLNKQLSETDNECDKAYISHLFYGTLEKSVQFDYVLSKLVKKKPKPSVSIIIKMGLYMLRFCNMPNYAATDKAVKLAKALGKEGVSGFVNAVLRSSASVNLPSEDELPKTDYLSVVYSVPKWIVSKLVKDYGYDTAKTILSGEAEKRTHIRNNNKVISYEMLEKKFDGEFERTQYGWYVSHALTQKLSSNEYTVQSLASLEAVHAYIKGIEPKKVLDLCGAPGGKSVYLGELVDAKITCCDIHPHRVELIKKYAQRMKSDIIPCLCDARQIMPEWIDAFDMVICDVPCSGTGDIKSKPDVMFNRTPEDIDKLNKSQLSIIETAKMYVRRGGYLCYSTCSIFKQENDEVIAEFLRRHEDFALDNSIANCSDGYLRLFPSVNCSDGFFVARLIRK